MVLKFIVFTRFDRSAEGRFSLPLAFFFEVAISQIFPLKLSWAKVKKLNERQFYLKFFAEKFGF